MLRHHNEVQQKCHTKVKHRGRNTTHDPFYTVVDPEGNLKIFINLHNFIILSIFINFTQIPLLYIKRL